MNYKKRSFKVLWWDIWARKEQTGKIALEVNRD